MTRIINLIGQKYGRLTVIERYKNSKNNRVQWKCKCDCGNYKIVTSSDLRSNKIKSCGCLRKEKAIILGKNTNLKHNMTHTRIYRIWISMRNRCYYKKNIAYKNYGGRGITIYEEWKDDFMNFYNWAINNGYKDDLTIDRIDVNGNYEPNNCRWVDMKQQQNNRRNNRTIIYKNKKYTLSELSNFLKISNQTLLWRINNYWKEEELTLPVSLANNKNRKENNNE